MNTELWMGRARESIQKLETGTPFALKDLFEGVEWRKLEKGDRLGFGKYFKNAVLSGTVSHVEYIGKLQNNSASYRKL